MIHTFMQRFLAREIRAHSGPGAWIKFASLSIAFALWFMYPAKASATTWYVSSLNTGYNITGTSWSTAWPDMNYINWYSIQPGDTIKIDTGSGIWPHIRTAYSHPITVTKSGTAGNPITIMAAPDAGHNAGIIDMQGGINIGNNSYINISGTKWYSGLAAYVNYPDQNPSMVPNFMIDDATTGITIASGASNINVTNLWIARGGQGINLSSANNITIANCLLGDNQFDNIAFYPAMASPGLVHVQKCWMYGTYRNGNGLSTYSGYQPASNAANVEIDNCLLGPGLGNCIDHRADHTTVNANGCLLVDAILDSILANNPSGLFNGQDITSFQTPLNTSGQGNYCLAINNSLNVTLNDSIIYGGTVTPTYNNMLIGSDNFQFRDAAATYLISPQLQDPQFISNVATVPNTATFDALCLLNFALQPTSPVLADPNVTSSPYFATRVSSVSQFLGSVPH